MRNVPDKSCKGNKTRFVCNNFFPENRAVCEIMWKNTVEPDRSHDNIAHTHYILVT